MMMRRSGMLMVAAAALAPVRGVPAPGSPHTSNATDVDGQWARLPGYAATVATGISFYTAEQGMVIGGSNGIGPQVSTTFDGGATFHSAHFETEDPLFMFVDGEMLRGSSVVSGFMAWAWQSQDQAREFHAADAPLPINPGPKYVDSVLYNGAPTFVITGDTGFFNGVSISRDSGRTFEAGINIFDDRSTEGSMWARSFAADPTGERWFVSGGAWSSGPASDDDDSDDAYIHFSEQLHLRRDALNASGPLLEFRKAPAVPRYTAGMARSDDGGRTWRLVYESENQFYFSGMACFDRERCLVVANGFDTSQILATVDGGFTWESRWSYPAGMEGTLTKMVAMPNGEAWACGGGPAPDRPFEMDAHFWHTQDYGQTWELSKLPGGVAFDISFPPGETNIGYAALVGVMGSGVARFSRASEI